MRQNALTYLFFSLLLALLATSCKDDTLPASPTEEADGSGVYVSIVVNTGGNNASRADGATDEYHPTGGENGDGEWLGEDYENTIHNLYLYFFDGGDENGVRKGINAPGNTPIIGSVEFTLGDNLYGGGTKYYTEPQEINSLQIGKTYDVLAIANIDGVKALTTSFPTLGALRDAASVEAISHPSKDVMWFVMSSANPTFDAEQLINSVKITGNNSKNNPATVNIDVERLTARIDCHVENSGVYEVKGTNGDKVKIQGIVAVNKYVMNDKNFETKGYIERSYWFKRVSEGVDLTGNISVKYLGDEQPVEGGPATNYVIGPMTLTPPDIKQRDDQQPYDHSFYFNKNNLGHWEKNWDTIEELEKRITSEHNDVTYHLLDYVEENVIPAEMLEVQENKEYYCTGVLFKAQYQPVNKATQSDGTFYWYNNTAYADLQIIATELNLGENALTDENCDKYSITKYPQGICYYTYWIRHADDGDDTKISPMEYAIVRNNIYQLNVRSISGIGTIVPADNINVTIETYVVNWEKIDTEDVIWGEPVSSN